MQLDVVFYAPSEKWRIVDGDAGGAVVHECTSFDEACVVLKDFENAARAGVPPDEAQDPVSVEPPVLEPALEPEPDATFVPPRKAKK